MAPSGKGDGYFAQYLKLPIPDLTTIQQRNNGVFPTDRMVEIIDGRTALKGHGPRNMPIWGTTYTEKAANYYRGHGVRLRTVRPRSRAGTDGLPVLAPGSQVSAMDSGAEGVVVSAPSSDEESTGADRRAGGA